MTNLSFIEKQTIYRLFGISEGFIFKYWSDRGYHSKNDTKDIILEACGINIYEHPDYKSLSQQKCIEKIFNKCSPHTIAKLLDTLCEYFAFKMGSDCWSSEDGYDYDEVQKIIKRLKTESVVDLPQNNNIPNINLLLNDIKTNIEKNTPEMAIDRLYTFSIEFFKEICAKHNIALQADRNGNYTLTYLAATLKKWYEDNNFFESEFVTIAIGHSFSLFDKFNFLRNNKSPAHANILLNKTESEFVVRIVADTLMFIHNVENCSKATSNVVPWDGGVLFTNFKDDELPF